MAVFIVPFWTAKDPEYAWAFEFLTRNYRQKTHAARNPHEQR